MVYVFALSSLLAVTLLQTAATLPGLWLWPTLLGGALASRLWPGRGPYLCIALLGASLLGGWAHWNCVQRLQSRVADVQDKQMATFDATIIEIPVITDQSTRMTARLLQDVGTLQRGTRLLLSDYVKPGRARRSLHAGEIWHFSARLKRPHGLLNPGPADREAWLWAHGIRASATISHAQRLGISPTAEARVAELRERLSRRIQQRLAGRPGAALVSALVVGDSSGIPQQQWTLFAATGITHLVSISGLHVTLVAGQVAGLVALLWGRLPRAALLLPTRRLAAVAGILAAIVYAVLAGFSVPTQRTLFMLMIIGVQVFWLQQPLLKSLAWSLIMVLVHDPFAVLTAGLWLSFSAVALMAIGAHGQIGRASWPVEALRAQWAVTIGLLPALIAFFGIFPWTSPLANLIAIPVISALVTPLALLGSIWPWIGPLQWAEWLVSALLPVLQTCANLGLWKQAPPPPWLWMPAMAAAVCLVLPRGIPGRWPALLLFLPMLLWRVQPPAAGSWRATVLDVGQGLAVVVQTQNHNLLYDSGPDWPGDGDSGLYTVLPALQALDIRQLDRLMLSHDDIDHVGGAPSILAQLPVRVVHASLPAKHRLWPAHGANMPCRSGQSWQWDQVRFTVLNPLPSAPATNDNDGSCVLRISSTKASILLPGDIGANRETELVQHWSTQLQSSVLLAPHHGSKKSSTIRFIETVQAKAVIFSAGYRNHYQHPHPHTLTRYADSDLYRTDEHGAVALEAGDHGLQTGTELGRRPRFWRDRGSVTAKQIP